MLFHSPSSLRKGCRLRAWNAPRRPRGTRRPGGTAPTNASGAKHALYLQPCRRCMLLLLFVVAVVVILIPMARCCHCRQMTEQRRRRNPLAYAGWASHAGAARCETGEMIGARPPPNLPRAREGRRHGRERPSRHGDGCPPVGGDSESAPQAAGGTSGFRSGRPLYLVELDSGYILHGGTATLRSRSAATARPRREGADVMGGRMNLQVDQQAFSKR